MPTLQVRQELPVRIAHRIRDLQNLPFSVGLNPRIESVYTSYLEAFERIRGFPLVKTLEENDRFCALLSRQIEGHWGTVPRMMTGLLESASHLPAAPRERFMNVRRHVLRIYAPADTATENATIAYIAAGFGKSPYSLDEPATQQARQWID